MKSLHDIKILTYNSSSRHKLGTLYKTDAVHRRVHGHIKGPNEELSYILKIPNRNIFLTYPLARRQVTQKVINLCNTAQFSSSFLLLSFKTHQPNHLTDFFLSFTWPQLTHPITPGRHITVVQYVQAHIFHFAKFRVCQSDIANALHYCMCSANLGKIWKNTSSTGPLLALSNPGKHMLLFPRVPLFLSHVKCHLCFPAWQAKTLLSFKSPVSKLKAKTVLFNKITRLTNGNLDHSSKGMSGKCGQLKGHGEEKVANSRISPEPPCKLLLLSKLTQKLWE